MRNTAWIDASAGVAGDMLLGAFLDAGADLGAVQAAVAAVVPGEVRITTRTVARAGQRALRAEVDSSADAHPHRAWRDIRALLEALPAAVRGPARATFARLAGAEARVHGVEPDDVHFHEVGSWDSIADIVGVCAAVVDLGVTEISASPVALGSGRISTAHGDLPVPAPAVLELTRGWQVLPGGAGERATPTGMALLRELAATCGPIPAMTVARIGIGAGGRDGPERPNVTRVVIGSRDRGGAEMWVLETNLDDLDPRVWPSVIAALMATGAADAWLVPIIMKKGRPAHTLTVLAHAPDREPLRAQMITLTGTLGVRESPVERFALDRASRPVTLADGVVGIKLGLREGRITVATPEFEDADALARARGVPVRHVLDEAAAAAAAAGLRPGERWSAEPG